MLRAGAVHDTERRDRRRACRKRIHSAFHGGAVDRKPQAQLRHLERGTRGDQQEERAAGARLQRLRPQADQGHCPHQLRKGAAGRQDLHRQGDQKQDRSQKQGRPRAQGEPRLYRGLPAQQERGRRRYDHHRHRQIRLHVQALVPHSAAGHGVHEGAALVKALPARMDGCQAADDRLRAAVQHRQALSG